MSDVFVSWGGPDEAPVAQLVERLRNAGLEVFEYSDRMRAGDQITERVLDEIHRAKLALLCMSQETAGREWLERELHWSYADLVDDTRPMRALMPVLVGPMNIEDIPSLIRDSSLYVFDLSEAAQAEDNLNRLLRDVQEKLGGAVPLVIPATIYAMTRQECESLLNEPSKLAGLKELSTAAGMSWTEDNPRNLVERYGDAPRDFAPFADGRPLIDAIHDVLRHVNQARGMAAPLSTQWYERSLLTALGEEGQLARNHWRRDCHLFIVDSISLLMSSIAGDFVNTLALTRNDARRALIWVPPYTTHTFRLETLTGEASQFLPPLNASFEDWLEDPDRTIAFDTATDVGFRRWVNLALRRLADPPEALAGNLEAMVHGAGTVLITPDDMNRGARKRSAR